MIVRRKTRKVTLPQVSVPIVADVHFHFQQPLEAIDAGS
jgi:4-hydroxy-3-methylbut-2-en-1-yl diphosphate synthase IspG/GcpE